MTADRPAAHQPILSIITWPEGYDREQVATLLAEHSRLDVPTLRMRLGAPPPMILGLLPPSDAKRTLAAWRKPGGEAFAPTLADIEALGPTLKIRDLRIEEGSLAIDLWRGGSRIVARESVQILIRAQLREKKNVEPMFRANHPQGMLHRPPISPGGIGWAVGGAMGLAVSIHAQWETSSGEKLSETVTSDKLDIHTTDGRVFQIDGDKFGFRALGELRGHSDRENMDRMCELLAHVAPNEIVDPYYSLWRPPPLVSQLRLPDMKYNRDVPAFAFYSRWAALMYRHLLSEPTSA